MLGAEYPAEGLGDVSGEGGVEHAHALHALPLLAAHRHPLRVRRPANKVYTLLYTYIHTYIHAPRIVTRSASVALRAEQGRRGREESGAARCHASAAGSALPGVAAGCALYATDWLFVFGHVTCVTRSPARIAACECVLMRSL